MVLGRHAGRAALRDDREGAEGKRAAASGRCRELVGRDAGAACGRPRRAARGSGPVSVRFEHFVLDSGRRDLSRDGTPVHLSPKAFELLEALVECRPDAVSKADLFERLWPQTIVVEGNLPNLVAEIRAALGGRAGNARLIRTVHRFGYAFCGEATELGRPATRRPRALFRLEIGTSVVELAEGENLLGRDRESVVPLRDSTVSRRHAVIRIAGCDALLEDLGSKNGTRLRGRRVKSACPLTDGDEIRVGSVWMVFRAGPDASSSTNTSPPSSTP